MSMAFKTLLVEKEVTCPNCDHAYGIGAILYEDEYRDEILCPLCREDYEEAVFIRRGRKRRIT
jgi:uncharacterized protein YbaR (Trm112 family)